MKAFVKISAAAALLLTATPLARAAEPVAKEEPQPAAAAPARPEAAVERRNPFAPSAAMRERARRIAAGAEGGTALAADAGAPQLAGLIVRDKAVLACFRIGGSSAMVGPGESVQCAGLRFVFVKYADETVTLRNEDGAVVELRLGSREKP